MSTEITIRAESVLLDPTRFHQALELAKVMAKADCMPAHLRGKPADCLRVVELAARANQSPYALADKTYLVQGKIAFEGQLCAALVNSHPSIEQRLSYDYEGDEDKPTTLKCTVSAKIKGEGKPRTVLVTWIQGDAQSKGAKDKWKSQPAQQLAYYGARVWARRHTPEILLGMYTTDELEVGHIGPDHARDVSPQSFGVARFATPSAQVIDHDPDTGEVVEESPSGHIGCDAQGENAAGGPSNQSPQPSGEHADEPAATTAAGNGEPAGWKARGKAITDSFKKAQTIDALNLLEAKHREEIAAFPDAAQRRVAVVFHEMRERLMPPAAEGSFADDMAALEPDEWKNLEVLDEDERQGELV